MAMESQPMFQEQMLRQHSKASMRGNRAKTLGIQTRLAEMDIARKLAFGNLGLQRRRSDLAHKGRKASMKLQKGALKQREKQLPWQIGIGAGTALLSGLEGRRQANKISEREARNEERYQQTQRNQRGYEALMRERFLRPRGMGINE